MTWDPINVNIYYCHLRWVQDPTPEDFTDAEWAEQMEEDTFEFWLTYSMAKKAMERMIELHIKGKPAWWVGTIDLTHPDTHHVQATLFTVDEGGEYNN